MSIWLFIEILGKKADFLHFKFSKISHFQRNFRIHAQFIIGDTLYHWEFIDVAWEIWLTPTLSGFVGDFFELVGSKMFSRNSFRLKGTLESPRQQKSHVLRNHIFELTIEFLAMTHPAIRILISILFDKNVQITVTTRKNFALTKFLHSNFVSGGMLAASPYSKNWLWTFFI